VAAGDDGGGLRRGGVWTAQLAVGRQRDYQVTDDALATWKKGLRGVASVETVVFPGDTHRFGQGTGKPGPAE